MVRFSALTLPFALLLVAACTEATTQAPAPVAAVDPAPEEPKGPRMATSNMKDAPQIAAVETGDLTEESFTPPFSPDRLLGLGPRDVEGVIGEPGLVRNDGPVTVMLFEGDDCVLDVVFRDAKAASLAARTPHGSEAEVGACLAYLLRENNVARAVSR
ncbi:hypothetical protein [Gimibacter soli]|uniref:Uncharacterized protein n=1 Tax=Gimibacter soli TaxID=3024400 RepID=A0AAF0BMK8_9PROT|nr:hypothetical protein [Gimibacter soli]WCL54646.1 hypothetical protein PH603_02590 [Gimibacter soli]